MAAIRKSRKKTVELEAPSLLDAALEQTKPAIGLDQVLAATVTPKEKSIPEGFRRLPADHYSIAVNQNWIRYHDGVPYRVFRADIEEDFQQPVNCAEVLFEASVEIVAAEVGSGCFVNRSVRLKTRGSLLVR